MGLLVRLVIVGIAMAMALPAAAQGTLQAVKKRDKLLCGVNGQAPGFSALNEAKQWAGLDVDLCKGVAAAALGDANKVTYIPTTAADRFTRLAAGEFDMLARNSTISLPRSVGTKVRYATFNYVDGQAFVVPKAALIPSATALNQKMVCVVRGTSHQANMLQGFRLRGVQALMMPTDTPEAMYEAFFAGKCQAVTQDASVLAGTIIASGKAGDYLMLPEIISKEPFGPYVRDGDSVWLDVVRWTHYAMLEAEEREITRENVDVMVKSPDLNVQKFLGALHGNGKILGLDEAWAYNVVKQVGNYGEAFDRNIGQNSPLKFGRGVNNLWTRGGVMIAPPFN